MFGSKKRKEEKRERKEARKAEKREKRDRVWNPEKYDKSRFHHFKFMEYYDED